MGTDLGTTTELLDAVLLLLDLLTGLGHRVLKPSLHNRKIKTGEYQTLVIKRRNERSATRWMLSPQLTVTLFGHKSDWLPVPQPSVYAMPLT